MQMSSSKPFNVIAGLVLTGFLLLAPLMLAVAETEPAGKDNPEQPPVAQKPDEQAAEQAAEPASSAAQTPPAKARPVNEFKPTEKIGADSAVAFPIDI